VFSAMETDWLFLMLLGATGKGSEGSSKSPSQVPTQALMQMTLA